ncbi:MAG: DEAD/DEAH box helicase family protein [Saprospiraceae bacterium]|nr:DEAD/DEAH box helicase family protein [Saprospiraceae bacterium]
MLPEEVAANLKRQLKFEVLDNSKTSRSGNKVQNPNARKVSNALKQPFANVFVVNAEKVILDKVDKSAQYKLTLNRDDDDYYGNELRNLISKIPHLSIFADEVHHFAGDSSNKIREVVNLWNDNGNITTVVGFTGTPYLNAPKPIQLTEKHRLRIAEITNTVYYYPLTMAIERF